MWCAKLPIFATSMPLEFFNKKEKEKENMDAPDDTATLLHHQKKFQWPWPILWSKPL